MSDGQFGEFLELLMMNEQQYFNLQRLTYANNNELGNKSIDALVKLIKDKYKGTPITHIALVNLQNRISSIQPLMQIIQSTLTPVQSLILPKLNLGIQGFKILCSLISRNESTLKVLDISWAHLLEKQISNLFKALGSNESLESLNLAMISISKKKKLVALYKFLRRNTRLTHLNLSGMFKTVSQVRFIIKGIAKADSLLVLHISHTPCVSSNRQIQSYIRKKLRMGQVYRRDPNSIKGNDMIGSELRENWFQKDNLRFETNVQE